MKSGKKTAFYILFFFIGVSIIWSFYATFLSGDYFGITYDKVPAPASVATPSAPPASTTNLNTKLDSKKYPPVDVDMVLKQVAEHTWYVKGKAGMATENAGFISNSGVVITDEGVVIFDALGSPSLAYKMIQKIKKITDKPIVKVIISHYHADHIYGLQVFKALGAEIIAPDGVYEYIDSDAASSRLEERRMSLDPWVDDETQVVVPDRITDKSETFSLGGIKFSINVIGNAHSDGDMTLYVENDRVLFTGDIIFEGRVPFLGSNNTKHWLKTLEKIEQQKLSVLIPGHGPATTDPKAITLTRRYLAYIREKMGAAVEDMQDFDEAYDAVDWSEFSNLPAFQDINRKNAFQVYLSMEAEGS